MDYNMVVDATDIYFDWHSSHKFFLKLVKVEKGLIAQVDVIF